MFINYLDYIKSERWKLKRMQAFQYHGIYCKSCKLKIGAHMHHIHYKNLGHEGMEDLIPLCEECHEQLHKKKNMIDIERLKKCLERASKHNYVFAKETVDALTPIFYLLAGFEYEVKKERTFMPKATAVTQTPITEGEYLNCQQIKTLYPFLISEASLHNIAKQNDYSPEFCKKNGRRRLFNLKRCIQYVLDNPVLFPRLQYTNLHNKIKEIK